MTAYINDHRIPLVYVAGPYNGRDYLAIDRHISAARDAAKSLVDNGIYYFCPHLNSAHFEAIAPSASPAYWYDLDIRILRSCDAVLLVGDWTKSKGTLREIEVAKEIGIPVFDYTIHDSWMGLLAWRMKRELGQ